LFLLYEIDPSAPHPLVDKRTLETKALPALLLVSFVMILAAIVIPEGKP